MKKATNRLMGRTPRNKKTAAKPRIIDEDDDMLDDYGFLDWSKAERGKYARRYTEGSNIVVIAPDLTELFPNSESVNQALRALADVIRASSAGAGLQKRAASKKTK